MSPTKEKIMLQATEISENVLGLPLEQVIIYRGEGPYRVFRLEGEKNTLGVLRLYEEQAKRSYQGFFRWLPALKRKGVPVPELLASGKWEDTYYTFTNHVPGVPLAQAYSSLSDEELHQIAKEVVAMTATVSTLPKGEGYGLAEGKLYSRWIDVLLEDISRYQHKIEQNGWFTASVCEEARRLVYRMQDYFDWIVPTPFLTNLSVDTVLVEDGHLSGVVGVHQICYGDSYRALGNTRMALVDREVDTAYIDHLLFEYRALPMQRKATMLYTLLSCVSRMAEVGHHFKQGQQVGVSPERVRALGRHYTWLQSTLEMML